MKAMWILTASLFILFIYLLKLRGCCGRVARPIIAVHIKYYKYVLQKLTVGAIEIFTARAIIIGKKY
jgi:hypothetical protein